MERLPEAHHHHLRHQPHHRDEVAAPPRLHDSGERHAGEVEHVADAYQLQGREVLAARCEALPGRPDTAVDEDDAEGGGEEGEDDDGARGEGEGGGEAAIGCESLKDGEAELDADWGAQKDARGP